MAETTVHFVRQHNSCVELLEKTFTDATSGNGGNCVWMDAEECLKVKERQRKSVFIFDKFEGAAFKNIIQTGNRIYGPLVLLYCMKNSEILPKMTHPVHNLTMKKFIVSCTSLEKAKRETVHQCIEWMCGEVSKDFHDKVTHLVAGEVGSKKYLLIRVFSRTQVSVFRTGERRDRANVVLQHRGSLPRLKLHSSFNCTQVAASLEKRIMSPEWVSRCWEDSQTTFVSADSDMYYDDYRCKVFKGCVITVSGLDADERAAAREVIEKEGGRYTGEMKINECTHLIINQAKGQKYQFARKWHIYIVKPVWLYDSVEAGYCIDTQKYKLSSDESVGDMKLTSTPQADTSHMAHAPDISCISVANINETAINQTLQHCAPDPTLLDSLELRTVKAGMFLDGCKLFISGFAGLRLEKLRKLINLGGGTRFSQINETITHVVMGDRVQDHITQLEKGQFRLSVVSAQWLVACARDGGRVPVEPYLCLDLPTAVEEEFVPPIFKPRRSSVTAPPVPAVDPDRTIGPDEMHDEMQDLLSQYLPVKQDMTDDSELVRAAEAAEQQTPTQNDDDMTQDPTEETQDGETQGGGLFMGKKFALVGLAAEDEAELRVIVEESDGLIVGNRSRTVPDYAVVPTFGCHVPITATDVVTIPYIQYCLESGEILPLSGNPIFTPLTIRGEGDALSACVLSISGYTGVEREVLMHIAEVLGAKCQEYFVKQAKRNLQASTHLIVNSAAGSKYAAAKKWNLPTVQRDWLFECARTGTQVPEEKYLVDRPQEEPVVDANVPKSPPPALPTPAVGTPMGPPAPAPKSDSAKRKAANTIPASTVSTPMGQETHEPDSAKRKPANTTPASTVSTPMDQEAHTPDSAKPKSANTTPAPTVSIPMRQPAHELDSAKPKPGDKENVSTTSVADVPVTSVAPVKTSQTETNVLPNQRVKALISQGKQATPARPPDDDRAGIDTPGKFLKAGVEFMPKFDYSDFLAALETPEVIRKKNHGRKQSLPLGEQLQANMAIALKNSLIPQKNVGTPAPRRDLVNQSIFEGPTGPLKGVVITVSKKLSGQQSDLNNVAADLGADYRWTYDQSCTHFIFQGRRNDTSKEFKLAREHRKIIVSPYWITMCKEQNAHVDEALFPHDFNPSRSISVTSTKKETPNRLSTRRSTRSRIKPEETASPALLRATRGKSKLVEEIDLTADEPNKTEPVKSPAKRLNLEEAFDTDEDVKETGFTRIDKTCSDNDLVAACEGMEQHKVQKKSLVPPTTQPANTLAREAFVDDITNLMANTKHVEKRRSRRTDSLSGEPADEPESKRASLSRSSNKSEDSDTTPHSGNKEQRTRGSLRGRTAKKPEVNAEPSQMVEVTWDDPQTRRQQEKLAAELAKNSESLSPAPVVLSSDEDQNVPSTEIKPALPKTPPKVSAVSPEHTTARIKTPEPPSLAIPTARIVQPAGQDMMEEETENLDDTVDQTQYVFLFSGMSQAERTDYGALVEQLGGCVSDASFYDAACTHLVVGCPTRNEKYLACVAAGKWVLHKSYLEACRQQNCFVQEDDHEWGSDATQGIITGQSSIVTKLARAAHRWRCQVKEGGGAFSDWNCVLVTDKKKEDGFVRLLLAGGATISSTRPPFTNLEELNFAFLDLGKVKQKVQVDIEALQAAGVHCVKPDYIATYLMDDPLPRPRQFYIAEVTSSTSEGSRKRKPTGPETPSKRSRRQ